MSSLKNFGIDKVIEKVIKEVAPKFFAEGANAFADKIAPTASNLLRNKSSEGGKLMSAIREARKLKK